MLEGQAPSGDSVYCHRGGNRRLLLRCLGAKLCVNRVRWAKASVPRDKL